MNVEKTTVSTPESRFCRKHEVEVRPFYSVKQNKWFWLHHVKDPITGKYSTCFVNSEEEESGWWDKQFDYANDARAFNDEDPRDEEDQDVPAEGL